MRILFTSHRFAPDVGGIEVNSEILARCFAKEGCEVRLVTRSLDSQHAAFPFSVIRNPSPTSLLEHHRWADVVFQNNIELGTLWPALFSRKPLVVSVRTWIRSSSGYRRPVDWLKLYALRRADAVIAISEAIRLDSFAGAVVFGNPYRSSLFRQLQDVHRTESVAFLGRLVSDKGADILVRAISQMRNGPREVSVIGSGPEEANLRELGKDLGVRVRFVGQLQGEELVRELNRHEVLVVPSRWAEPFGNVALEGMACGCVVIGSKGGGLPDAIGQGGLLFERGSASDLADVLSSVLESPELRQSLRKKATEHLRMHTEDVVAARYLSIVRQVCLRRSDVSAV